MMNSIKSINYNVFFSNIVWVSASIIIALSLIIPDGYSIGAVLVLLISSSLLFLKSPYELSKSDKTLILSYIIYSLGMFYLVYLDDFNVRWLDKPARFLLATLPLILLLKVYFSKKVLFVSCFVGAIGPLGVALIERFYLGYPRAEGDENPIMFGGISMLIALICLNYAFYFYKLKNIRLSLFSSVAFLSGLFASLLSGSKGSWVVLPITATFLLWNYRKVLNKKAYKIFLLGGLLLLVSISFIPALGVSDRVSILMTDVNSYLEGSKVESSVSHRTELWKASILMFQEEPIYGIGRSDQQAFKQQLVDDGISHESVLRFTHAHNEYLNELGLHGIFGLILLLTVYLGPLSLFLSKIREYSNNWNIKVFAIAGALVPLSYMGFALTQAMFVHNSGVMMYAFTIIIFWAATRWAEREERELENID